jgi:hypothetical protein
MLPELFSHPGFAITPEAGRSEPKLWVRRLVIWSEPGRVIRDISLRPGLNIIWSPDPGSTDAAMGHGGGKTMFCRFLRFCLGEESFAPEAQRHRIPASFPKGRVGAEVLLEGQVWLVVRSIGERKRDIAVKGESLDNVFEENLASTGIEPLRKAITEAVIGDSAKLIPETVGESGAWEAALAWATRDQECRFDNHLDWRARESDSHSPARRLTPEGILMVVRALIGALSAEEIATQREEDEKSKELGAHRQQLERLEWQFGRTRAALAQVLGSTGEAVAGSPLDILAFKSAASKNYAKLLKLPVKSTTDVDEARRNREIVRDELRRLEAEEKQTSILINEKTANLSRMRSELPEAHARLTREQNPICPICEVPIDKALAEGCRISTATCDLNALQMRINKRREGIRQEEQQIKALKTQALALKKAASEASKRLAPLEKSLALLERAMRDRSNALRVAQRLVEDTERYEALIAEKSRSEGAVLKTSKGLEKTRDTLIAHRAAVAETIYYLSTWFDAVLRELVPGEIRGTARLDGNGLTLKVELGGDRSTAAIESLKVVAFDLAALAMSIEGKGHIPSFLVHDSPREADLGASIYNRIFDFGHRLESSTASPLFQYIITTTTEPPEKFRKDPWLRLTIRGAPAPERLLGVDL